MFGFALGVAARAHYFLRSFMPTNIVLNALQTRRGLKWGMPAMLLAVPYVFAAVYCTGLVEADGSGWLSALSLLFLWNALKFFVAGPATLLRLVCVRRREARAWGATKGAPEEGVAPERIETPFQATRS